MLQKSMFKKQSKTPAPTDALPSRVKNYNIKNDECRWPIYLHDRVVQDCNFDYDIVYNGKQCNIVRLKKGTVLYHTTFSGVRGNWWNESFPSNTVRGGVFFNSSAEHQFQHAGTHQLVYETKCDMYLIFIRNIHSTFGKMTGNEFVTDPKYKMLLDDVERKHDIKISGYMGCNECEIFIHNQDVKNCIYKKPKNVINKMTFMD